MSSSNMMENWYKASNKKYKLSRKMSVESNVPYTDGTGLTHVKIVHPDYNRGDDTMYYPSYHSRNKLYKSMPIIDKDRFHEKINDINYLVSPFNHFYESADNSGISLNNRGQDILTQRGFDNNRHSYPSYNLMHELPWDYPQGFFKEHSEPVYLHIYTHNDREDDLNYPKKVPGPVHYFGNLSDPNETLKIKNFIIHHLADKASHIIDNPQYSHMTPIGDFIEERDPNLNIIKKWTGNSEINNRKEAIRELLKKLHTNYEDLGQNRPERFSDYINNASKLEKDDNLKKILSMLSTTLDWGH